ncbi:SNF2 family N-terminal domain-containing protein [Lactarius indigo]|nr:SNF2 family N-terminal domain-containing protein [Lactarius indigo]
MATPVVLQDEDILSDVVPSNIVSRQEHQEQDELMSEDDDDHPGTSSKAQKTAERRQQKQKRKDNEGKLVEKRHEMDKAKVADAVKRYSYLLGQTDLFRHFVDVQKARDSEYAAMIDEEPKAKGRGRKKAACVHLSHIHVLIHGLMRPYQLQGLNWMVSLYHNSLNGILADEMGLGKTLQTISFLAYLKHQRSLPGLHLVVVPKSTLQNWAREFEKWTPDFNIALLTGSKEERAEIIASRLLPQNFQVCITSYEICLIEKSVLKKFSFEYIVIDEAHRIKNVDSILSQIVRSFSSRGRLLITGTPLQNNLKELFALLNFICPEIFIDYADLEAFLHKDDTATDVDEEKSKKVVEALHKILRPFLLRRVKSDVEKNLLPKKEINIYVGLTDMQRKWYRSVLEKDIDAVNGLTGKKEGKTRLMNMVMQLRKVTCHPYLFDGAEPGPPYTTDEHLIQNSGKMVILDKLLKSMKEKGSRVLIFSQMSRMLDILEDYCLFRGYKYCRIDGGTAHEDRIAAIDEYNKPGSEKFIFLLTTRAGGLGINLTTADIVVLYDSDWNPQADLQAMDRAHRIGQTKQVYVFRFITEESVEERMLERGAQKLRLDQLVIQQGRQQLQKAANKEELLEMITHGAEKIVNSAENFQIDDDIDAIIQRGEERTAELSQKYEGLNLEDLSNFKSDSSLQQWEGEDFRSGQRKPLNFNPLSLSKRERKLNYSVDGYFKETMRAGPSKTEKAPKLPRAPKQISLQDFQFFPPKLAELQERELAVYKRLNEIPALMRDQGDDDTPEKLEAERQAAQDFIDTAEPLTEEELQEKEELIAQGFEDWSRRDFQQFVRALESYGWTEDFDLLASEIQDKTPQDVAAYYPVFRRKWKELSEHPRIAARIAEGEAKRNKRSNLEALLSKKIGSFRYPMQELELNYPTTKGKVYSEEEDRYLLCRLSHYGMRTDDVYERIKKDISEFPVFRFDWFFKSRSPQELQRRCNTLLGMIEKEAEQEEIRAKSGGSSSRGKKRVIEEVQKADKISRASTPASASANASAGGPTKRPSKKKKT